MGTVRVLRENGQARRLQSLAQIRATTERSRHRTFKQLRAQPFCGYSYYLGGTLSVLRKIEARWPDVDVTRAEAALLTLRRDLKKAFRNRRG